MPYQAVVPTEVPNGFSVYHLKARDENGDGEEVYKYVMVGSGERKRINTLIGFILDNLQHKTCSK